MSISANMVRELRDKTAAGMMDCKKALEENGGDFEKAIDWLRKKGLSSAGKKAGRVAAEGTVEAFIKNEGKVGVLLEVNSETDFVGRSEGFREFVKNVAFHIGESAEKIDGSEGDTHVAKTLEQPFAKNASTKLGDYHKETIAKTGENIVVRRFAKYTLGEKLAGKPDATSSEGAIEMYIHGEGRIGVLLEVNAKTAAAAKNQAFKEFTKGVAMHIAATAPLSISSDEVPAALIEREREVLTGKAREQGKKEEMLGKIVDGQIKKWLSENCLMEQAFVKNPDIKVGDYLKETIAKTGENVVIRRFVRFELGEGIQKKTEDFAAEVAAQIKG
jgi:elongation factor Ts